LTAWAQGAFRSGMEWAQYETVRARDGRHWTARSLLPFPLFNQRLFLTRTTMVAISVPHAWPQNNSSFSSALLSDGMHNWNQRSNQRRTGRRVYRLYYRFPSSVTRPSTPPNHPASRRRRETKLHGKCIPESGYETDPYRTAWPWAARQASTLVGQWFVLSWL